MGVARSRFLVIVVVMKRGFSDEPPAIGMAIGMATAGAPSFAAALCPIIFHPIFFSTRAAAALHTPQQHS